MNRLFFHLRIILLVVVITQFGCSARNEDMAESLSFASLEGKIKIGMSEERLVALLGAPTNELVLSERTKQLGYFRLTEYAQTEVNAGNIDVGATITLTDGKVSSIDPVYRQTNVDSPHMIENHSSEGKSAGNELQIIVPEFPDDLDSFDPIKFLLEITFDSEARQLSKEELGALSIFISQSYALAHQIKPNQDFYLPRSSTFYQFLVESDSNIGLVNLREFNGSVSLWGLANYFEPGLFRDPLGKYK